MVSDTHLSTGVPSADAQWEAVLTRVESARPALVVHCGDISAHGSEEPADLAHARRRLDELAVPWLAIPGNHDLGDMAPSRDLVDDERRARFTDVFGKRSWTSDLDGWRLIGVDTQTLCGPRGDVAESDWADLAAALDTSAPAALFTHRPLRPCRADTPDSPARYVSGAHRRRIDDLLRGANVRLVVSGHVHQWWSGVGGGRTDVWAPSAWAVLPASIQPDIGAKCCGVVSVRLSADGAVSADLVRPDGMPDLTIGVDFESPYDH